jgi:hypothetical protein
MPSLSINFNPAVGPLIQLSILPFGFQSSQPGQSSSSPLNLQNYMALIDTGASHTAISAKVISALSLTPIGKQPVGGVHGQQPTNLYQFQVALVFPQSQLPSGMMQANLVAFAVTGTEFVAPGAFDVLLGRDVLCRGLFTMSFDGHASLSV